MQESNNCRPAPTTQSDSSPSSSFFSSSFFSVTSLSYVTSSSYASSSSSSAPTFSSSSSFSSFPLFLLLLFLSIYRHYLLCNRLSFRFHLRLPIAPHTSGLCIFLPLLNPP